MNPNPDKNWFIRTVFQQVIASIGPALVVFLSLYVGKRMQPVETAVLVDGKVNSVQFEAVKSQLGKIDGKLDKLSDNFDDLIKDLPKTYMTIREANERFEAINRQMNPRKRGLLGALDPGMADTRS